MNTRTAYIWCISHLTWNEYTWIMNGKSYFRYKRLSYTIDSPVSRTMDQWKSLIILFFVFIEHIDDAWVTNKNSLGTSY